MLVPLEMCSGETDPSQHSHSSRPRRLDEPASPSIILTQREEINEAFKVLSTCWLTVVEKILELQQFTSTCDRQLANNVVNIHDVTSVLDHLHFAAAFSLVQSM